MQQADQSSEFKRQQQRLGWIGVGRMGRQLVERLLQAGHAVAVYNRTRAKAESLVELGATVADSPAELADCALVFTMVAGNADIEAVTCGPAGLFSRADVAPTVVVDLTTISPAVAAAIRTTAERRGTALLAAPVSGNPKVAASGRLTIVASGPRAAWSQARPYLERLAHSVTYVGEGERARLVKICHNLMLGVVAQCMAEVTILAEKGGVSRAAFLGFLNDSVLGSTFTRYKTPAYVNLDFTPTFTPALLLKDFHLGMNTARELEVAMPVAALTEQIVQALAAEHGDDLDFAALIELVARASRVALKSEDVEVDDGLEPLDASTNDGGEGTLSQGRPSAPKSGS